MRVRTNCGRFVACVAASLLGDVAVAQYAADFEAPTFIGSPDGTVTTGQYGYCIPSGTTSIDYHVFTYAGNPLGIPENPAGGGGHFGVCAVPCCVPAHIVAYNAGGLRVGPPPRELRARQLSLHVNSEGGMS